ncbi:hypothetical protein NMG60_11006351 [Bertholletia excelsa]
MEPEGQNGNTKNLTMHTESSHDDSDAVVKGSVSSSSSPALPFDPVVDLDDRKMDDVVRGDGRTLPLTLPGASPQMADWSMISLSPRSGPAPLSSSELNSPNLDWSMQSPPIQTMGQPDSGYDPSRIPSSIFSSRPATGMEWSVASNESLFSLHMGNNSFSGDHGIQFSKVDEPTKLDESNKLNSPPPTLPTVMEVASDDQRNSASTEASYKPQKDVLKDSEGARFSISASNVSNISEARGMVPTDASRMSASTPRLSDESGNSGSSFAFPVLTNEAGRNGTAKPGPDCSDLKPVKESEPLEEPKPQSNEVNSKDCQRRWFSCFSCCSTCC